MLFCKDFVLQDPDDLMTSPALRGCERAPPPVASGIIPRVNYHLSHTLRWHQVNHLQ